MTKGKGLPAEKKDFLKEAGFDEETLERLDSNLQKAQALASNSGLESKDVTAEVEEVDLEIEQLDQGDLEVTQVRASVVEEEPETDEEVAEVVKAAPAAKAKAKAKSKEEEAEAKKKMPATKKKEVETPVLDAEGRSDYPTRQEIADALIPMMETIEALTQTVENLTKEISDLKAEDAEKIALTKEVTPTLSLADIISRNAIGKSRAVVKESSSLNKEGPVETEAPPIHQQTMVPLINEMIQKSRTASRNGVMAQ